MLTCMKQWITHIKIYTSGCKINKKQPKKTLLTLRVKNEGPRTIKFKVAYIYKIIYYTYNKISTGLLLSLLLVNKYNSPCINWPQAQKKARSKWQAICGAAMSSFLCNCPCPQGRLTLLI